MRHAIEGAIERALRPGTFIRYRSVVEFVRGLQAVADRLAALVVAGNPELAADLYQTFIAACHEKAEELDDSGGDFGGFVQDLFVGWLRARQALGANVDTTVRDLARWMDDDPCGFCSEIEREITKVMDRPHLAALACLARERLDRSPADDGGPAGYPRRRWELARALEWVQQGLTLASHDLRSGAVYDLERQQLSLLPRLGRADEARSAAWARFEASPSRFSYETLMEHVPEETRAGWRQRAMKAAEGAAAGAAIELFVETGESLRLARYIETTSDDVLERLSHYVLEPAAKALRASHPALAARLYRALAQRILTGKASRYYSIALRHLERARDCYRASSQEDAWDGLIRSLQAVHRRKTSLMPGLARLANGRPARERRPSLVERAKRRWPH